MISELEKIYLIDNLIDLYDESNIKKRDKYILKYIYKKIGLELNDQDLLVKFNLWDKKYLLLLGIEINNYDINKLSYIIKNSFNNGLMLDHFKSKDDDIYTSFNKLIYSFISRKIENINDWYNPIDKIYDIPNSKFKINFIKLKKKFQVDYYLGNISECCIQIGGHEKRTYRPILLDYFIDSSILIFEVRINNISIGQIFYTLLLNKSNEICFILSSIELNRSNIENINLIYPILDFTKYLNSLFTPNKNMYLSRMTHNYPLLSNFFKEKLHEIKNLRTTLNQLKLNFKGNFNELKNDIILLNKFSEDFFPKENIILLTKLICQGEYIGARYYDIFVVPHNMVKHGFIECSQKSKNYILKPIFDINYIQKELFRIKAKYFNI